MNNKNLLLQQISNTKDDIEIIRFLRANDFEWAKTIWGKEDVCVNCGRDIARRKSKLCYEHIFCIPRFEYHLQALVLADDIKKYIQDNI